VTERGDSLSAAALLEHQQFLRRLAYRLVGDAQAAEDIAQTTLLADVERPPNHPNLRA